MTSSLTTYAVDYYDDISCSCWMMKQEGRGGQIIMTTMLLISGPDMGSSPVAEMFA